MARWMNTDAVAKVACPQCNQPAGSGCRTPSGRKCAEPHGRRVWALQHTPGFNMADYQVDFHTINEIVRSIIG